MSFFILSFPKLPTDVLPAAKMIKGFWRSRLLLEIWKGSLCSAKKLWKICMAPFLLEMYMTPSWRHLPQQGYFIALLCVFSWTRQNRWVEFLQAWWKEGEEGWARALVLAKRWTASTNMLKICIQTTECISTGSLSVLLVGPQLVFRILLLSISIWLGVFNILFS